MRSCHSNCYLQGIWKMWDHSHRGYVLFIVCYFECSAKFCCWTLLCRLVTFTGQHLHFVGGFCLKRGPHFQGWQQDQRQTLPSAQQHLLLIQVPADGQHLLCWITTCSQFTNQLNNYCRENDREIHSNLGNDKPVRTHGFSYLFVVFF